VDYPPNSNPRGSDESGIALFMVIAAMTILSILVTEFTYVTQVNQRMAYDALDQVKAQYLAKAGFKFSLLRLKAYQQVSALAGGGTGGAGGAAGGGAGMVPKGLLEKIWSFPFFYPLPTDLPGMSINDKDMIQKFQKNSSLEGKFSAIIESESSRFNINQILSGFVAPAPSASPSPSPSTSPSPSPTTSPSASPTFNPEAARESLGQYLTNILEAKFLSDEDFAANHRDLRVEELVDSIAAYADPTYQKKFNIGREKVPFKKAPFYTLSELRNILEIDDELYELFSPGLTVSVTPGININQMKETTLKALVPGINDEEVADFFKFRDSETEDNAFKTPEDFFTYLQRNIAIFRNDEAEVRRYREGLERRGMRIVTNETNFRIVVRAQVGQATRVLEAQVTLLDPRQNPNAPGAPATTPNPQPNLPPGAAPPISGPGPTDSSLARPSSGFRVTFMRIY
jgi:type II secretory pathway component PulK